MPTTYHGLKIRILRGWFLSEGRDGGGGTEIHDNHYRIYQFILVFTHSQKILWGVGGNQFLINIIFSSVRYFLVKISSSTAFFHVSGGGGGGDETIHIKKYQKSLLIKGGG